MTLARGRAGAAAWSLIAAVGAPLGVGLACGSDERPRPPAAALQDAGAGGSGDQGAMAGAGVGGSASSDAGAAGSAAAGQAGATAGGGGAMSETCIPRQNCQKLCAIFGNDPACGLGTGAQCGCVCEERFNGPCPGELEALLACAGSEPSVDCSTQGRRISGCAEQSLALEICDFRAREQLCAESFPNCMAYCRSAVLSSCSAGPETVTSCLCGCEASFTGACGADFDAFMACTGDAPSFECDSAGRPAPTTCASEWQSLMSCLQPGTGEPPDAG